MAKDDAPVEEVSPLVAPPVEEPAVTGRPADTAPANSTFASRSKAVSSAENKSVAPKKAASK